MLKIVVSKFVFMTRIAWLESFVRNQISLMEPSQAEEIMEYVLQGVGETPIVHLDKSASTLVPLVEQEKKSVVWMAVISTMTVASKLLA